jgi:Flp pilus assembly protein TadB
MSVTPFPATRVGDPERERAAAVVTDAVAEGLVGLDEVDTRLGAVWSARTEADLSAVTADLPPGWLRARGDRLREQARRETQRRAARAGLRGHLASYLSVMVLLVAIWLVVGLAAGAWYPWPVWPALGWGIGVLSHVRAAYGTPGERWSPSGPGGCRVR